VGWWSKWARRANVGLKQRHISLIRSPQGVQPVLLRRIVDSPLGVVHHDGIPCAGALPHEASWYDDPSPRTRLQNCRQQTHIDTAFQSIPFNIHQMMPSQSGFTGVGDSLCVVGNRTPKGVPISSLVRRCRDCASVRQRREK